MKKCSCKKCGYEWEYTGKLETGLYTTCHRCRNNCKIEEE
jgi:hypothetical protein